MPHWIDISVPLRPGIPQWPGDPLFSQSLIATHEADGANVTALSLCAHTATHIDAPLHYFPNALSIAEFPLSLASTTCAVLPLDGDWRNHHAVLFRTANSASPWWEQPFHNDFAALTPDLARRLVASQVQLVGIDYLSVGRNDDEGAEVHRILLGAGIWLLEGLNLSAAPHGDYQLLCLPLKLHHADGAPARALLYPL